jgi:hypothetical protein
MSSNTEAERFIDFELTDEIKKEQIVTSFKKDNRTNNLFLKLNHAYKQKQIISPIYEGSKWSETVNALVKKLKHSGVSNDHILLIEDVLTNNFETICGQSEDIQKQDVNTDESTKRPKKVKIRKYTASGTLPLRESIVFQDGQTAFVSLDENGRPRYETELARPGVVLYPADSLDTHNPLPYTYESPDELSVSSKSSRRNIRFALFEDENHL